MEMFFYGFMQRALIAALLMAIVSPLLGVFLVLRRQSLLADTLSHVSLAGVALGLVVNWSPTVTTLIVVVLAACLVEYIARVYKSYAEIGVAVLMAAGLALALVLMSVNSGASSMSVDQYLFGSIVTITSAQVELLAWLAGLVVVAFTLFKRPLYVLTFDEETAFAEGLPVKWMAIFFNVLTGVTIAVMMPIAGALLVSAIMVLPATIALRLGRGFNLVLLWGILIGLVGMVGGLVASYKFNTPPGASITLLFIALFVLVLVGQALIAKVRHKKQADGKID